MYWNILEANKSCRYTPCESSLVPLAGQCVCFLVEMPEQV